MLSRSLTSAELGPEASLPQRLCTGVTKRPPVTDRHTLPDLVHLEAARMGGVATQGVALEDEVTEGQKGLSRGVTEHEDSAGLFHQAAGADPMTLASPSDHGVWLHQPT
jgi:hypothetical protein